MSAVLIIGGGGREHALAWKLSLSSAVRSIVVSPGNAGTNKTEKTKNIDINSNDHDAVLNYCTTNKIDLVVVGPEDPLANGLADVLKSGGIACFGPSAAAAKIEASKRFAKEFMERHSIPTARYGSFTVADKACNFIKSADFPALVVKASGLAAGKGVVVCTDKEHACHVATDMLTGQMFGRASESIVVEELLFGQEISALAFTDGKTIQCFPPAQDHKRLFINDEGPNTGGMGAYCPAHVSDAHMEIIKKDVLQKAVDGMRAEGYPFVGVLYAGLMITEDGPKVLEFNCRFGDPETQVLMPLLNSDLYGTLQACVQGSLHSESVEFVPNQHAVAVIAASGGYPGAYAKGFPITDYGDVNTYGVLVFHAGTKLENDVLVTNGGRVLAIVAVDVSLIRAAHTATAAIGKISFEGMHYRTDIAASAITSAAPPADYSNNTAASPSRPHGLTYSSAGVDISAGDSLVDAIKPLAALTKRVGCAPSLGGFGGVFDLKATQYVDPLLVSGTDGVGTKLKIAQMCNKHDTIGEDLVAMCVNDILAHGAEPLFFLDYYACGKLDVAVAREVVKGVASGCVKARCALVGGETAEMPGIYSAGDYDLAGFTVGAVERALSLPNIQQIAAGDAVIGLPSTGVHSNGYSLVRKVVERTGLPYTHPAPFDEGRTIGESLLTPTQIYVQSVLPLMREGLVKAFAHITGGGLPGNVCRVLPSHLAARLDANKWNVLPVFGWLAHHGRIEAAEMSRTFNCGVGACLVVDSTHKQRVLEHFSQLEDSMEAKEIGIIEEKTGSDAVIVEHLATRLLESHSKCATTDNTANTKHKRARVGVLISGSGTNLQALIDAAKSPTSSAEICLVISNKPGVRGLERAQEAGIPCKVIKHKDYKSREEFDRALDCELRATAVQIVCLAGFMRILSGWFVSTWEGRLLNVHPSLLPSFKGANAHEQVIAAGVRVSGCTVHFVSEEVDAGAIIVQETVAVAPDDTVESLSERVKSVEHVAFPRALELVASQSVRLQNGKCVWAKQRTEQ